MDTYLKMNVRFHQNSTDYSEAMGKFVTNGDPISHELATLSPSPSPTTSEMRLAVQNVKKKGVFSQIYPNCAVTKDNLTYTCSRVLI